MIDVLFSWLLTYLLHSSVLLALAWGLERAGLLRRVRLAEVVWRIALFGAFVTASLQGPLHAYLQENGLNPSFAFSTTRIKVVHEEGRLTQVVPPAIADGGSVSARSPDGDGMSTYSSDTVNGAVASKAGAASAGAAFMIDPKDGVLLSHADASAPALPAEAKREEAPFLPLAMLEVPAPLGELAPLLVAAWLLLAGFGGAQLLHAVSRLNASAAACPLLQETEAQDFVHRLSAGVGRRTPVLRRGALWDSPLVLPNGDICLPDWTREGLSRSQREAMLAHEVAHVMRRDPAWRVAMQLAVRLCFFQPFNRLAANRLALAAELSCDAWAAKTSGQPRALAEALYTCAQFLSNKKMPGLALAMTHQSSPLLLRVGSLLKEGAMFSRKPSRTVYLTVGAVLFFALVALTFALPQIGVSMRMGSHFRVDSGTGNFSARIDGDIVFDENETDVTTLSRPATITQQIGGHTRSIEFTPKGNGVERVYSVDQQKQPLDAEGRAWLAEVIPFVLRESGINVRERATRLFAKGGATAVMDEIDRIKSNYARGRYLQALATLGPLDAAVVTRMLAAAVDMRSDFERRGAYEAMLRELNLTPAQLAGMLGDVAGMQSDFEKAQLIKQFSGKLGDNASLIAAWSQAVKTVHSDFEASNAIGEVAAQDKASPALLAAALQASAHLGSSFEQKRALERLASHVDDSPELAVAYIKSTRSMNSDFEKRGALSRLLETSKLNNAAYTELFAAVGEMASSFEACQVLLVAAANMPADAELIKQYRHTAKGLGDYERGQAEKALDRIET